MGRRFFGGGGKRRCPQGLLQVLAAQESVASVERKVLSCLSTSLGSQAVLSSAPSGSKVLSTPQQTNHSTVCSLWHQR